MIKDIDEKILQLTNFERDLIKKISNNIKDLDELKSKLKKEEISILNTLQVLDEKSLIKFKQVENEFYVLDKFGLKFLKDGLPEIQILKYLLDKKEPVTIKEIIQKLGNEIVNSGLGILRKNNYVEFKNGILSITKKGKIFYESMSKKNFLKLFENGVNVNKINLDEKKVLDYFKFREGFIKKKKIKKYSFELTEEGKKLSKELDRKGDLQLEEELTYEMLKNKTYKGIKFRYYDINVKTSIPNFGRLHPMTEVNKILSDIFIEMGFKEMIGPMIESAFWDMDVMWIPQDHPAREEQDTFYLNGEANLDDEELLEKVKLMHEEGIKKSHTSKGEWSLKIAKKLMLRTHSTATTFRTLKILGEKQKKGENIDGKFFYIANNFRNETIDATHLAEFFQGEGFIIGDNLSLSNLKGFIREFFKKLGITKIKFKPTFNPYTEPSMEAHYYDPKIKKWMSLINSGIFRPETLKPFGLENKTIIAWGLGSTRVAYLLTKTDSLRKITGYTCDYKWLREREELQKKIINN